VVTAPTSGKVGDAIPIVATFSDEINQLGQGVAIEYSLTSNGATENMSTQVTNSSSIAVQNFEPSTAGTYTIKASYAGDEAHTASSQEVMMTISKVRTTLVIALSNSTIKIQNPIKISATLTDENQQPIERATIDYQVSEAGGQWTNITSITTNFNGVATADYVPLKAGTVIIRAVYNGDQKYVQILGSETDLMVTEDNPIITLLPWILIVVVIAVVALAAILFVRARKGKQPAKAKAPQYQDYGY
jgi:hypothetical protein